MLSLEEKEKLLKVNRNIHAFKGFLLNPNIENKKIIEGTILSCSLNNLKYLIEKKQWVMDSIDFLNYAIESNSMEIISFLLINLKVDIEEDLVIKSLKILSGNRELLSKSLNYLTEKKGLKIEAEAVEFYEQVGYLEVTEWSSCSITSILKILPNYPSERFLKACITQLINLGKYNKEFEFIWSTYKDTPLLKTMLNDDVLVRHICSSGNVSLFKDFIKYGLNLNKYSSNRLLSIVTNKFDLKMTKALYENNFDMSSTDILNGLVKKLENKTSYEALKDNDKENCLSVINFLVKVNKGNYGILKYREKKTEKAKKTIENKIINQRLNRLANHNKNILYIAENDSGLIKIGITEVSAEKRVEKFTKDYGNSFKLIFKFDLNNSISNTVVETLFHEILNSKFLNINFLQKNKLSNEFEDLIKVKDNGRGKSGYTEIFVLEKNILKNLLVLMHLLNLTKIKSDHLNTINLLKENDGFLSEIKNINKVIKKNEVINTFKDKNLLIKPLLNNQTNVLKKNFAYIVKKIQNDQINDCFAPEKISLLLNNNKLILSYKSYSIDGSNIIHGCSNDNDRLTLLNINEPDFKSFKELCNMVLNIRKENLNLSGQKNYIKMM